MPMPGSGKNRTGCGRTAWRPGVVSGPGLWLEELEGLDRCGLLEQLLAEGAIGEAVSTAPHGHKLDRVLTAKNTLLSLTAGCLFAGQGYDQVLRTVFAMPGLDPVAPGTPVPTGPGARTPAERRSRPTEEATYTITITPSNLPQWQQTP